MKVTKVSYTKAFVIGAFLQEKVGIEIETDNGESPEAALDLCKRIAEDWHIKNNPQVHDTSSKEQKIPDWPDKIPVEVIEPLPARIQKMANDITKSKDLEELETYRLMAYSTNQPLFKEAFENRQKELLNQ